ncbi:MAG: sulfotransferase domain-containing protein [Candidatus Natronoplasma sp.]
MDKKQIDKRAIIIPGAQKSGTTTLFDKLSTHSIVDEQECKEPEFFALDEDIVEKNLDWYRNLYSDDRKKYLIDSSNLYFHSKKAPSLIKNYITQPKIIIILRDPVKRAYSGYLHMHKKVPCPDKRSFEDIVKSVHGPDRADITKSENRNIMKNIEEGNIDKDYLNENYLSKMHGVDFKSFFEDTILPYKHFQRSIYSTYVRRYMNEFDDVKVIFLEELLHDTVEVLTDLLDFLELGYEDGFYHLPHKNITKVPSSKTARVLLNIIHKIIPRPTNEKLMLLLERRSILYKDKPTLREELYYEGRQTLKKEYDYWISKNERLATYWTY